MEKLLTLQEASKYLRINQMTLYKMAWQNKVPVYKVGRQWRFKRSLLDKWLKDTSVTHTPAPSQKKLIFFTGATGYLGSNLIPKLLENEYRLKLLVRAKKDNAYSRVVQSLCKVYDDSTKLSLAMTKIEIVEGDLAKKDLGLSADTIRALSSKVTDIFHCAAAVSFDEEKEETVRKNNIEGTKHILSFAKKLRKAHFHYMSTAFVCGQKTGKVKESDLDTSQKFNNAYESSKCEAEDLVRKFAAQYKIKTTIYRPSIIVGDSRTGKTQSSFGLYGILRIMDITIQGLKLKYKRNSQKLQAAGVKLNSNRLCIPLRVLGKPNKTLNLITIDYATETIIRIFKNKKNVGMTYHITNSSPPRVELLKNCLGETLNAKGIRFVSPKAFKRKPMQSWERIFNKSMKMYTPYLLLDEAIFDNSNTRAVLRDTKIKEARMDKLLILKLMQYSRSTKYGKNNK